MRQFIANYPQLVFSLAGLLLGAAFGYFAKVQALALMGEWGPLCGGSLVVIVPIWAGWGVLVGWMFGTTLRTLTRVLAQR